MAPFRLHKRERKASGKSAFLGFALNPCRASLPREWNWKALVANTMKKLGLSFQI